MESLASRSDTSIERYRVPITIGVAVVVGLVMLFAFVLPSMRGLKAVTRELADSRLSLKNTREALSTAEVLIQQRYGELEAAKRAIFTEEEFYSFYSELLGIVNASKLSLSKLEMGEPKPVAVATPKDEKTDSKSFTPAETGVVKEPGKKAASARPDFQLVAMPASLTLRSGFFSLYQFIRTLEVYDKLLTVDSISLKPAELAKADVTVLLSVYTLPKAAMEAGPVAGTPTASQAADAMAARSQATQGQINALDAAGGE